MLKHDQEGSGGDFSTGPAVRNSERHCTSGVSRLHSLTSLYLENIHSDRPCGKDIKSLLEEIDPPNSVSCRFPLPFVFRTKNSKCKESEFSNFKDSKILVGW